MVARVLLTAALLGCAVVTLTGMLAPIYPAADFLNHVRPFTLVGAGVLLIAALALRAPRLVWASATLVGLSTVLTGLPLLWSAEPAERSTRGEALASAGAREIEIVTLNMAYGDARGVARFLLREDADVVVLQEVGAGQAKALRALLRQRYPYSHMCAAARRCAAAILAKRAWVAAGHEPWTKARPELIWVQFDDADLDRLRVVGVHLALPFRAERQARQVDRLIALRGDLSGPAVFAGDFNMTPWSFRLHRLLASAGLRRHATFLRSWPADGQFRLPWPTFLIDHMITTPDIKSVSIRIGPNVGSDHLPVIARLRLPAS